MAKLRAKYDDDNIFNADETGIMFRALPNHSLAFKDEKRKKGQKKIKERITALVCISMSGKKEELFVIGKSRNPRCFKKIKKLPVCYKANSSAWMTGDLFKTWLFKWDERLTQKRRRILLLVDNCSAHPSGLQLQNIQLEYLPPNTTSILQPCDQGPIQMLKSKFRHKMCVSILAKMDEDEDASAVALAQKISLLDAVNMLACAWAEADELGIRNCWCKSGLKYGPHEQPLKSPCSVPERIPVNAEMWTSWLDIDANVPCVEEISEDKIIDDVRATISARGKSAELETVRESESEESEDEEAMPPTSREVRVALHVLKNGLASRNYGDFDLLHRFEKSVEATLLSSTVKQSTIDRFFV